MSANTAAGLVIFRRLSGQIQYLLLQASYGDHHWTPPKGHLESGEQPMSAALREVREETDYGQTDLRIFENAKEEIRYSVSNKPKLVVYWLAELLNRTKEVTLSSEHQDFKWLDLQGARDLAKYPEMQSVLEKFDKLITQDRL